MAPPRSKCLPSGISRLSRTQRYHKRGLWAIKAKNGGKFPTRSKTEKPAPPPEKPPKYYPAEDAPKPIRHTKKNRPTKLRASITPGTVLILLAGRYKGKRVVFLKQLESGLLLITGPWKINGVPLRRVNQAYVIATSMKVDISSIDVSKYQDDFFERAKEKKKKGESEFFDTDKEEKNKLPQEKKDEQAAVDGPLIKIIEQTEMLKEYIGARFSLQRGVKPHELIF